MTTSKRVPMIWELYAWEVKGPNGQDSQYVLIDSDTWPETGPSITEAIQSVLERGDYNTDTTYRLELRADGQLTDAAEATLDAAGTVWAIRRDESFEPKPERHVRPQPEASRTREDHWPRGIALAAEEEFPAGVKGLVVDGTEPHRLTDILAILESLGAPTTKIMVEYHGCGHHAVDFWWHDGEGTHLA